MSSVMVTSQVSPEELFHGVERLSLPVEMQNRYDDLVAKRKAETLTPAEHKELLKLIEEIEKSDAKRVKYLVELARLRGISLEALMDKLGIHTPESKALIHSSPSSHPARTRGGIMWLHHLLSNLLVYFLPALVTWTAAIQTGIFAASAPPAITTSASSFCSIR
jgi:hypothetical protein